MKQAQACEARCQSEPLERSRYNTRRRWNNGLYLSEDYMFPGADHFAYTNTGGHPAQF